MVKIQIEDGYLNVKDSSNFPITFKVSDIRDLSTRKGTFSKTITLVGDDNNNQLLGNLYDVNIQTGVFDINKLTRCTVLQDGLPIVEDAYLQLIAVNKLQSTTLHEQDVEYNVIIKDSQSDFFTKLGSAELTDLDFSDFDHLLTADEVIATFTNTDKYKYILPFAPLNAYPLKEFKPAIFAKEYFDRIFARAGFSYSWATIATERFERLLIPFNGDVNNTDYSPYNVVFNKTFTRTGTHAPNAPSIAFVTSLNNVTETQDNFNLLNPTTGVYNSPFNLGSGESINIEIPITYNLELTNSNAFPLQLLINGNAGQVIYTTTLSYFKNGVFIQAFLIDTYGYAGTLAPGTTTIHTNSLLATVNLTNILTTDDITFKVALIAQVQGSFQSGGTAYSVGVEYNVTDLQFTLTPSSNIGVFNTLIETNKYIPKKIKQSEFIKSIFNMYNLYVDIDPTNPNNLILITRDNYYDSGAVKDWTLKLAKDREQTITFLPELTKKKLTFSYKQDSDSTNKTYFEQVNEVYGQVSFTFDNEYIKDEERKELIFSPTPILKTSFGAYVPALSGASPNTNIRILYDGGIATSIGTYEIENYTGNVVVDDKYPYITHFDNPLNPSFDINYGTCDYYFYQPNNLTANNLYNTYYRRTINQINKGKMLTAYFYLRANDISTLKLNDKIRIDNSWWSINAITDYNANENTLTKVELLSIDEEIDLPPYQSKPLKPFTGTDKPAKDIIDNYFDNNNVINGGGNVIGSIGKEVADGGSYFKSVTTDTINGIPQLNQHVFKAKLTQSGTNPIVIESVMIDTIGFNITSDYISRGKFVLSGFDLTDYGFPDTFDRINYEINNSNALPDKDSVTFICEDTKIFIDTLRNGSHQNSIIPNSSIRSFILTVTLYI